MNHFIIPKLNPFKFIKDVEPKGMHFDDRWAKDQIRPWQLKYYYKQKWVRTETTKLQIESSLTPDALKIYNGVGAITKTINWSIVATATNYKLYELTWDVSDQTPNDTYFNFINVPGLGAAISEPIHVRNSWPSTLSFRYKNSFNDFGVGFSTGVEFKFRVEGDIPPQEIQPKRNATEYTNQNISPVVLKGYPSRQFNLYIGGTDRDMGVAPWVIDFMNDVFACDIIYINEKRYGAIVGAEFKTISFKGLPLITGSLEITDAAGLTNGSNNLQFSDDTPIGSGSDGIVIGYEWETDFFAPGSIVPINEVQKNE